MSTYFEIAGRRLGYDYQPLVIAELGINHGGSLAVAKQMVDAAVSAGVEIIKHQTHVVADEMSTQAKKVIPGHTKESIYDIMDDCALSMDEEIELQRYVEDLKVIFISTPFSRAAANRLQEMNVPAFKIGSGECNNYPLVEHICSFDKPIILSTGMNNINTIARSVAIIENNNIPYALLHCTNIYPTPPHLVRLGAVTELINYFPNAVVGLSDHTTTNHACFGAVALGASVLERHFTDSMDREGPDIVNSMNPVATRELIEGSRILQLERGGHKGAVSEEQPTIDFAFASVVSIAEIKSGDTFSKQNIWVKRPGIGPFFTKDFDDILGKKACRAIPPDKHIESADISD